MSPENTPTNSMEDKLPTEQSVHVFEIGQRAIVKRSDGRVEYNWTVIGQKEMVDPSTGENRPVTMVEKTVNGVLLTKEILTKELVELNEKINNKTSLDLGETAAKNVAEVAHKTDYGRLFKVEDEDEPDKPFNAEDAAVRTPLSDEEILGRKREQEDQIKWQANINRGEQ